MASAKPVIMSQDQPFSNIIATYPIDGLQDGGPPEAAPRQPNGATQGKTGEILGNFTPGGPALNYMEVGGNGEPKSSFPNSQAPSISYNRAGQDPNRSPTPSLELL